MITPSSRANPSDLSGRVVAITDAGSRVGRELAMLRVIDRDRAVSPVAAGAHIGYAPAQATTPPLAR
ncbi:hypothetical protein [Nocardia sp. NPDC004123]